MALIDVEPPSVRPCGYHISRPSIWAWGTVENPQLTSGVVSLVNPTGMWMSGFQSRPPASSSSTSLDGSALSLLATTAPAAPDPTTMYVYRLLLMSDPSGPVAMDLTGPRLLDRSNNSGECGGSRRVLSRPLVRSGVVRPFGDVSAPR